MVDLDFINPGLLGSSEEFSSYAKRLTDRPQNPYGPLRDLVRPYILRRLKTDKSIIEDLPDKTEVKTFCPLSRKQAALYQQAVEDLARQLETVDGIKRKGIVLTFLMRLKQICNHPSQWLGDTAWAEEDSGKFARLRDIAEVVSARQEKALVFTQFKETTAPLAAFLGSVFGRSGLVLHGETEVKTFCLLSRKQAALYQQAVEDLARQLEHVDGIERRGVVLSFLMRFKQICNHPSQWLGDAAWAEEDSGKLARLRDIAEVVSARQEKALVFTQFKETTAPLAAFLGSVFGRAGLVLHGETEVGKRKDLVRRFQEDESVPFFVLSVKAGGAGLNLTAASHVIHFDRWWNPAVENQATDRAFRIGQSKNVLVHKFICRGTVEDKIDQMIESKQQLAGDFLSGAADIQLTEMEDEQLLSLVALDLGAAMKEV